MKLEYQIQKNKKKTLNQDRTIPKYPKSEEEKAK